MMWREVINFVAGCFAYYLWFKYTELDFLSWPTLFFFVGRMVEYLSRKRD